MSNTLNLADFVARARDNLQSLFGQGRAVEHITALAGSSGAQFNPSTQLVPGKGFTALH